jgi:hypothetical protein
MEIDLKSTHPLWVQWFETQNMNVNWLNVIRKWQIMDNNQIFKDIKAKCWYDKDLTDYENSIDGAEKYEHYNKILGKYDLKNKKVAILNVVESDNFPVEMLEEIKLNIKILENILTFSRISYTIINEFSDNYDYVICCGSFCHDNIKLTQKIIVDDPFSVAKNNEDEVIKRTIITTRNWLKYDDNNIYNYYFMK